MGRPEHRTDCQLLTVPTYGLCTCDFDERMSSPPTAPKVAITVSRESLERWNALLSTMAYDFPASVKFRAELDRAFREIDAALATPPAQDADEGHPHLIAGEFQSDKYPTCPRGKVPLSVKDKTAQDLLWQYAQRRRAVDAEFATDLEIALQNAGYVAPDPKAAAGEEGRVREIAERLIGMAERDERLVTEAGSHMGDHIRLVFTLDAQVCRKAATALTASLSSTIRADTVEALRPFAEIAEAYERLDLSTIKAFQDEGFAGPCKTPDSHRVSIALGDCRRAAERIRSLSTATPAGETETGD